MLQNEERLRRLPPAQQQVLRDRAQVWNRMTPEQREHVRTDVLPRWRQMPPDRKQAIRQRLRVLQNMPEYARNQRLNDPNFTRGMSEEDRSTLAGFEPLACGRGDGTAERVAGEEVDSRQLKVESGFGFVVFLKKSGGYTFLYFSIAHER